MAEAETERQQPSFTEFSDGNFLDDINIIIKKASYVMWTHDEATSPETPRLMLEHDQGDPLYLHPFNADSWEPSPDGNKLYMVGQRSKFSSNSPLSVFLTTLETAGFNLSLLSSEGAKCLEGLCIHVIQIPAPKFKTGGDGKDRTNLAVETIITNPGTAAASTAKTAKTPAKKSNTGKTSAKEKKTETAPDDSVVNDFTVAAALEILGETPEISKKDLTLAIFKRAQKNPESKPMAAKIYQCSQKDEFLCGSELWEYNPETKTITAL